MVEIKFFDLKMNKIELKNLISEYEKEGWDYTLKDKFNPGIVIDPKKCGMYQEDEEDFLFKPNL